MQESRVIFILENASLTKGLVGKKRKILSSNDDARVLAKNGGKTPKDCRPDIIFEALRAILDSLLNKAGMVGGVYVKTDSGLLFEVKPHARIPRTCARFCGIILDLLDKKSVCAKDTGEALLRVVEGSVIRHLPSNSRVVGLSHSSDKSVDIEEFVSTLSDDLNLVFVVGAMAEGKVSKDYTDDYISVSDYPLSAKSCIGLVSEALDLDEELLLNKGPSGHGVLLTSRVDTQTSVEPSSGQKDDELADELGGDEPDEDMHDTSQAVATNCSIEVGSPSIAQPIELNVSSDIAPISGIDKVFESSEDLNPEFDKNRSLAKSELSGECGQAKGIGLNETIVSLNSFDNSPSLSEQADHHHHDKSTVNGFYPVSENTSFVDQSSLEPSIEGGGKLDINSIAENQEGQDLMIPEASEDTNVETRADMLSACKPLLQPCDLSINEEIVDLNNLVPMPEEFRIGSEEMSGMQDEPDVSVAEVQDVANLNLNEDQFLDTGLCINLDGLPAISENMQFLKENDHVAPQLPSPEKMLSVPDVPVSQSNAMLIASTPQKDNITQGYQDATMNKITGKKRSLTESTITLQSQNSVESSEAAQSKRSVGVVPDDNDLLSSILVGRRSTVLKVKSTPPAFDLVSSKRPRVTPRSSAHKRKVLVDDNMVLHGDTIRQQLINTEDIRRVRKKAPSTHPEIWILQKHFLENEVFNEPIFTGMSSKLSSLHSHPFDLSEVKLVQDDGSKSQSAVNDTIVSPQRPTVGDMTEFEGTSVSSVARDESVRQSAECPYDTPNDLNIRVSNDLCGSALENETITNSDVGHTPSQFVITENGAGIETECRREPVDGENDHYVDNRIESPSCLPCAHENNTDLFSGDMNRSSCFEDTNGAGLSEQVEGSCVQLDEQSSGKEALLTMDTAVKGLDFGEAVDNAAFGDMVEHRPEEGNLTVSLEDVDSIIPMAVAQPECSLPVNDENIMPEDMITDEGRTHELGTVNKDEFNESDLKSVEQREDSKIDPLDPVGDFFDHDTDFLNFDDDEIAEDDEHSIPNAEGSQILDNSGWSTRTRAVANYLQVLFHKEAQHGRTVLRVDNLLAHKSRKEASRMFFETLVLKTRDYIHVDQEVPYDNISIKPRARLLKSEF